MGLSRLFLSLWDFPAKNDMDELRRLLSLGVEVNTPSTDGRTALHVAAMLGSRGLIQYLIDQGANVNAVDSHGNAPLNVSLDSRSSRMKQNRVVNGICLNWPRPCVYVSEIQILFKQDDQS